MIKKVKTKAKSKSEKKVLLNAVDPNIRDCLNCALFFEQIIGRAVLDLKEIFPKHSTQSAGLALALASLTHPDSRRFAQMISGVTKASIRDFHRIKNQLMEAWTEGSKFLH